MKLNKDFYTELPGMICTQIDDIIIPKLQDRQWFGNFWEEYRQHVLNAIMETIANELEEVKEFQEWRPEEGEEYKYLNDGGYATYDGYDPDSRIDELNVSIGNCYPLNTPDEVIIKEQKLIPQAMHRLKTAAKKAWFEFDGSEGPDWSNDKQEKWSAYYDHTDRAVTVSSNFFTQRSTLPYFPTRRSYRAYIHNNQDDLKLLFGVE